MKKVISFGFLLTLILLTAGLLGPTSPADAAVFGDSNEVTYKEYWIDHSQFTAGCLLGGVPEKPNGSWYVEPGPLDECPKVMQFTIPDGIASALKAEIYIDLWRNRDNPSARFRINNSGIIYAPPTGSDWSRTPYVGEIELTELTTGLNQITFWGDQAYHIHDVAFRIYYDDANLITPGLNSDVEPPDGELVSITDDVKTVAPDAGGTLMVNADLLTLKAKVTGAAYVEFHAYYDGYDVDNDGEFRDWQNATRNNWCPGGREVDDNPLGDDATTCTINHIGTDKPDADGNAEITWELPYVINQPGVKFKIRLIDENGNVRDAAGGESAEFILARDNPVVYYTIPDFDDFGLHMSGQRPREVLYQMELPDDLLLDDFNVAYFLGMYWRKPQYSVNDLPPTPVSSGDTWLLGVKTFNKNALQNGINRIAYYYPDGGGTGNFIEKPGPMIVLKRIGNASDASPPFIKSRDPGPGSIGVNVRQPIVVSVGDVGSGINHESISMMVDGDLVQPEISGTAIDLELTYAPPDPLPYNTPIQVTTYACDLLDNCMASADLFTFTTGDPDVTAPTINNIKVTTTNTSATVTWETNELATTEIAYGTDSNYGLGTIVDPALTTSHQVELTNLVANQVYHYEITAADLDKNSVSTGDLSFQTKAPPGFIQSDDFSECVLDDAIWTYINPLNDVDYVLTGEELEFNLPDGVEHDIWKSGINAPRAMQLVADQNFEVEVKFNSTANKKTQLQGLLVQQDLNNYLRFNFQSDGSVLSLVIVDRNGGADPFVSFSQPITDSAPLWMRLLRQGTNWTVSYSLDGSNYTVATTYPRTLTMSQIGVFAGNTGGNPDYRSQVDYFFNTSDRINPEDPPRTLDLTVVGDGQVLRVPAKQNYGCNEPVILTAVPDTNWSFGGWSGDLTGDANPDTIIMDEMKSVGVLFTNESTYTLDVNVNYIGAGTGGTVDYDPDQPFYKHGTPVVMTATADVGWSFDGWTGTLSSTNPIETLPITSNSVITGTFSQDQYVVEPVVINEGVGVGGTITVDPDKPGFLYGESVTVTATPNTGWQFGGWEGDLSGTDLSQTFTMTQDIQAAARFIQDQYLLTTNVVSNPVPGGTPPGGVIVRTPDKTTYGYGESLLLRAEPFGGWEFVGWAGALSGVEASQTLTIFQAEEVTATFSQRTFTIQTSVAGPGSVSVTPDQDAYFYGDLVTITAMPDPGFELAGWSGDLSGKGNPAVFPVEQDYDIVATFVPDTTPIEILEYEVEILPGSMAARVIWTTDVPGTSRVDFGEDAFYGDLATSTELKTEHALILQPLEVETLYHFQITSIDSQGNAISTPDDTFVTRTTTGLVSDDFSACGDLNPAIWEWVDPIGDSSYEKTGRHVAITVPAGTEHNIFSNGNDTARVMQVADNDDFALEVKFDSGIDGKVAMQGIVIEQDDNNFMRFDFFKREEGLIVVYAASFNELTPNVRSNLKVADNGGPMWMRVIRTGDLWEQYYSFDGQNWNPTTLAPFQNEMIVTKIGLFAGNAPVRGDIPGHTAIFDYFFNSNVPIDPEDGRYPVNIRVTGQGSVAKSPDREGYACGEEVTLTAQPAPGWTFASWSGDLTGINPERQLRMDQSYNVTAIFRQGGPGSGQVFLPVSLR